MASIRDTLTKLLASDKPEPGTPLARAIGQYPFQQGEAPLEAPMFSPDDLIGTGIGKAAVVGGAKLAPLLLGHTAWHGSPHIFDKFLLEKLGTGEGAQAYGHGMYFAENPAVAKQYQAGLSDTKYISEGKQLKGNDAWAAQFLHDFSEDALPKKVDTQTAINKANEILKNTPTKQEIINKIKLLDKKGVDVENGALYKVDIPDEHIPKMLEWDKPLSEQSVEVQKALANLPHRGKEWTFKDTLETLNAAPHTKDIPGMNPTGQEIYSILGNDMMVGNKAPGQKYASDLLSKQGIKGIKYLDEGSRANPYKVELYHKGQLYSDSNFMQRPQAEQYIQQKAQEGFNPVLREQGTKNFVIFDPSEVKILERNNKLIDLLKQQ